MGGSLPFVRLLPGFAPKSTDTTEKRVGQLAGSTAAEVAGFFTANSGRAEAVVGCGGAVLLSETGPFDAVPAAACAVGAGKALAGSAVMIASGQYQASAVQTGTSGSVNEGAEQQGGEEPEVELAPYKKGKGHHPLAKRAFEGDPAYDPDEVLAVPRAELERLNVSHPKLTGAQQTLYRQFAATGKKLGWDEMSAIERQALESQGVKPEQAKSIVDRALAELKSRGVQQPTQIPWGGGG